MAFDRPSPVTELTQQLRLATTMTGGVSLAIWMAGVAREINLLAQFSGRLLFALLSTTLVGAALSLTTPAVRRVLFGDAAHPGWVGANIYWLGAQWWHPLIVVGAIALGITVAA